MQTVLRAKPADSYSQERILHIEIRATNVSWSENTKIDQRLYHINN